jgi:hypothetical protein
MQCLISIKEFVDMLNLIHSQLENSEVDNIQYDYPFLYNLVKFFNDKREFEFIVIHKFF